VAGFADEGGGCAKAGVRMLYDSISESGLFGKFMLAAAYILLALSSVGLAYMYNNCSDKYYTQTLLAFLVLLFLSGLGFFLGAKAFNAASGIMKVLASLVIIGLSFAILASGACVLFWGSVFLYHPKT